MSRFWSKASNSLICSSLIVVEISCPSDPVRISRLWLDDSSLFVALTSPWKILFSTGEIRREIARRTRRLRAEITIMIV